MLSQKAIQGLKSFINLSHHLNFAPFKWDEKKNRIIHSSSKSGYRRFFRILNTVCVLLYCFFLFRGLVEKYKNGETQKRSDLAFHLQRGPSFLSCLNWASIISPGKLWSSLKSGKEVIKDFSLS